MPQWPTRALARAVPRASGSGEAGASRSEPRTAVLLNGWSTKLLSPRAAVSGQQAIGLLPDDRIALAGARLEATAIEHGDASPAVFDQPGVLQVAGRLR